MKARSQRFQFAAIAPLAIISMALLVIAAIVFYYIQDAGLSRQALENVNDFQSTLKNSIQEEGRTLDAVIDSIEIDKSILAQWKRQKRQDLLALANPIYSKLNNKFDITHFYFINPDKICFLRVHQPDRHGDIIKRWTMQEAANRKIQATGIELGPLGTFTLRCVRPIEINGEPIGYLEVGKEIEKLQEHTRQNHNLQTLAFINKNFIDREKWETGMEMLGRKPQWDLFPDHVLISSTFPEIPTTQKINKLLANADGDREYSHLKLHDQIFIGFNLPLIDAAGSTVGRLVAFENLTAEKAAAWNSILIFTILSLLIIAAVYGFYKRHLERLANQLLDTEAELKNQTEEQIKTAASLQKSEERFGLLFREMPNGLATFQVMFDEDGKPDDYLIQDINPAFEQIIGKKADMLSGKSIRNLMPESEIELLSRFHEAADTGIPQNFEYHAAYIRKSFEVSVFLSNDERLIAFFADITERLDAVLEARRLARAVDQAAETIVLTDRMGSIEYVNPAFEKISGYSRQEAIGQNPRVLKSGKHSDDFYRKMWDTVIRGQVWQGEFINKRKDGSLYNEQATISAIRDNADQIIGYVAVKRDISEQRYLEKQLRHAQKMEAVGQLAGGVAHDFNNLLQVIQGYMQMAMLDVSEEDRLYTNFKQVLQASERATGLVRQLLSFSRHQVMEASNIDLNQLVIDLIKMLRRLIGEHIELDLDLDKDLPRLFADPGQIEQILMNLCVNARDAMPDGGSITIRTEYQQNAPKTGENAPTKYAVLTVADTGHGIDADKQESIFDPFYTTKEVGKGTGLGLATVYGIVKQHDGYINVHSEPGKGTKFRIFLPVRDGFGKESEQMLDAESAFVGGKERILLAEDEPSVRDLVMRILHRAGYEVLPAADGEEALEIFNKHQKDIHLVLLDVVMPRMNGKAVFEAIRRKSQVPIIFCSGYSFQALNTNMLPDEHIHLIRKPYQPTRLLHEIRKMLDAASITQ
ncbi:MAG: PAS domain S-box protein [Candidatus Sumerlaeia bacterium]